MSTSSITLSDTDFHKRIAGKYGKFKINPFSFPALIFYKSLEFPAREVKIGILVKLHFHISNAASYTTGNNILLMKAKKEKYIPQIITDISSKNDGSNIFLSFNEKLMVSYKAFISMWQKTLDIPVSAFPPASWRPAYIVSELFLETYDFVRRFADLSMTMQNIRYNSFKENGSRISMQKIKESPILNRHIPINSNMFNFYQGSAYENQQGITYLSGSGSPLIIPQFIPHIFSWINTQIAAHKSDRQNADTGVSDKQIEKKDVLKYHSTFDHDVLIRRQATHSSIRFKVSRQNILFQPRYISNKFLEFGSEIILTQVRFLLNNKEIKVASSHLPVYNLPPAGWISNIPGIRDTVSIFMNRISGNIFYPTISTQKENLRNYYSIIKHEAPVLQVQLPGESTGFDKDARNVLSQDLIRATAMNSIDTDLVYVQDQRKIENEVAEIKKIIEETKRSIPEMKDIQMTDKNDRKDALRHININQISDHVYQMIDRRIKIEAERRGIL